MHKAIGNNVLHIVELMFNENSSTRKLTASETVFFVTLKKFGNLLDYFKCSTKFMGVNGNVLWLEKSR